MKKSFNIKNSIIIILCFTIICMGIGFAVLSIKLEKLTNTKQFFDVSFDRVKEETSVKGGTENPTATTNITNNGKEIKISFNLNNVRDELAYTIYIKNNGTLPAKIYALKETPDYTNDKTALSNIEPVSITHNDITGRIINPNEEIELKVIALYNPTNKQLSSNLKKQINYELHLITASPKD